MIPKTLADFVYVALGGGIGAALRHGVNRGVHVWFGLGLPFATLAVNVVGCLLMGVLAGWFALRGEDTTQTFRLFLTTGVLGGFTTFSAFSLDVVVFWERAARGEAMLYVLVSVVTSVMAVFAGLAAARAAL